MNIRPRNEPIHRDSAVDGIRRRAARRNDPKRTVHLLGKDGLAHVDLIAGQIVPRRALAKEGKILALRRDLTQTLMRRKCRLARKVAESRNLIVLRLRMQRVAHFAPEHLIAAADAKERRPGGGCTANCIFQSALTNIEEILRRILRTREENEVWTAQLRGRTHIVERDIRFVCKRVKIGKIRQFRRTNHGDANLFGIPCVGMSALLVKRYRVLFVNAELFNVRNDAEDGFARLFLQELQRGRQERDIPAEFIDHKPLDKRAFLLVEQFECPDEGSECTAAVDVRDEEYGCVQMFCYAHIDNIVRLEIDLGGTARALDHDQLVLILQSFESFFHRAPRL